YKDGYRCDTAGHTRQLLATGSMASTVCLPDNTRVLVLRRDRWRSPVDRVGNRSNTSHPRSTRESRRLLAHGVNIKQKKGLQCRRPFRFFRLGLISGVLLNQRVLINYYLRNGEQAVLVRIKSTRY